MNRFLPLLALLLGACAVPPLAPELRACHARMEVHLASLMPGFAALGYRIEVRPRLDEALVDGRGFPSSGSTMGDASPGGAIRLRPSHVCADDSLGRAVLAHEIAHVALQHRGMAGSGVTLQWEKPPRIETEANELAYAVLKRVGGDARAVYLVGCWLGKCNGAGQPDRGPHRR